MIFSIMEPSRELYLQSDGSGIADGVGIFLISILVSALLALVVWTFFVVIPGGRIHKAKGPYSAIVMNLVALSALSVLLAFFMLAREWYLYYSAAALSAAAVVILYIKSIVAIDSLDRRDSYNYDYRSMSKIFSSISRRYRMLTLSLIILCAIWLVLLLFLAVVRGVFGGGPFA